MQLTEDQFVVAVCDAPKTRPDRYTVLEHWALSDVALAAVVPDWVGAME